MIRSLLIAAWLLLSSSSFGQPSCQISELLQQDKILLQKFWTSFKTAIDKEDKKMLAELCDFPFDCDYCDDEEFQNDSIKVSRKSFDKNQYKLFFNQKLKTHFNKKNILEILSPNYGALEEKCSYRFGYICIEPSSETEGRQIYFVIEKINGKFKIISTWTVP